MARPIKNNAQYFSHDADMRNDIRIKAIRNKFGMDGYAMWCMMLEILTDSDNFTIEWDSSNIELISADFGTTTQHTTKLVNYLLKLNLLQLDIKTKNIRCDKLINRFTGLLSKRKRDRTVVIADDNTTDGELSPTKTHKVKYSIVNKKEKVQIAACDAAAFVPPTVKEVRDYFYEAKLLNSNPINFFNEYENKLTANWKQDALNYAKNGK
jgi:hypothetical protein